MYNYKDLAFRVILEEDLEPLMRLHNDKSTFLNLALIHLVDREDQKEWLKRLHSKSTDKRFVICLSSSPQTIVGRCRIQNIDFQNSNAEIGLDILPEERGKGYGVMAYEMLLEFLFLHFNMNMVYLKVASYNENALTLYSKLGFEQTGYLKNYLYRHGRYMNYHIMCMTKEDYLLNLGGVED